MYSPVNISSYRRDYTSVQGINYNFRFLSSGSIVEIYQRFIVDFPAKNRKIRSYFIYSFHLNSD